MSSESQLSIAESSSFAEEIKDEGGGDNWQRSEHSNPEDNQDDQNDDCWLRAPRFVTKTHEMISQCDPEVASWSDDGEMFIVKDQILLSSKYIPQYFGHSNFSSFDRQLNFYGFRKSFPDVLRQTSISDLNRENAKHVRFYHEYFKRGRPDLFHLIKRASTKKRSGKKSDNDKQLKRKKSEVEDLREEVTSLECLLTSVSSQIETKFAQLSKQIEENISSMRVIVCEASSKIFQRHHHPPVGLASTQRPSSASAAPQRSTTTTGRAAAEDSSPHSLNSPNVDFYKMDSTSAALPNNVFHGDFYLDERRLTNIQRPNSTVGRISTEDVSALLKSPHALLSPNGNIHQKMGSVELRNDFQDDFSLDEKSLTNIQRPNSRIERISTEDVSAFLRSPQSFRPSNAQKMGSTAMRNESLDDILLPPSLKEPPREKYGRSTTDEIFNLLAATSESGEHAQGGLPVTGGAFSMLRDEPPPSNRIASSAYNQWGGVEPNAPMIDANRPNYGIPRTTEEEFFGAMLQKSNSSKHERESNEIYIKDSFNLPLPKSSKHERNTDASGKFDDVSSSYRKNPNSSLGRTTTEHFINSKQESSSAPKMGPSSEEEAIVTTAGLPVLNMRRPNKGLPRMSTEEFFGVYFDENNGNSSTSEGNDAATLLMLAGQNLPRR